jgi:lipoyl synthase
MRVREGMSDRQPKPAWLKAKIPSGEVYFKLRRELREKNLHTVCQSARCPNTHECWNRGHATLMILGDICTRDCRFCSVVHGTPLPPAEDEADSIVNQLRSVSLRHVVLTSVTRDDLPDHGSAHFAAVIQAIKRSLPQLSVEVLSPDFGGEEKWLARLATTQPDVWGHNIETTRSLYHAVNRPPSQYDISLRVLAFIKRNAFLTKTGFMIGLGETRAEILALLSDLAAIGVDILTIGQYLQPTGDHLPVERYYTPLEFTELKETALAYGFKAVESGPFVRSSYHSGDILRALQT